MEVSKDTRKTCLITGCSPGGIGHSLAVAFHARGYRVFATARSPEKLSSLSALGIETLALTVDDEASRQACLAAVKQRIGPGETLNFLVNNAGVNYTVPALDLDISEVQRMFDTNVFSVMRLVQLFTPLLISAASTHSNNSTRSGVGGGGGGGGTIVMIASVAGVIPYVFGSAYNASKAALQAYANTLRVELAPFNVHVSIVMTGGVKSHIGDHIRRALPPASLYTALDDVYLRRQTHSQENAMSNEDFAASVVSQVVPGGGPIPWRWFLRDARKRWIWEGKKSWLAWFLSGSWTWTSIGDIYMTLVFSLWKLRDQTKTAKKRV